MARWIRVALRALTVATVTVVCLLGPVSAQERGPVENPVTDEPCPGSADLSACLATSDVNGKFYACSAKGSWGGFCITWGDTYNTRTKTWEKRCVQTDYSASCSCDSATGKLTGSCTYKP